MIKGFIENGSVKKRKPSIVDVAKAAGVSIGTASAVINNKYGSIRASEGTKLQVQEAVRMLGYRPNAMARGLRLNRMGLLGVILDGINYSIMPEILQGIEDVAKVSDYSLILGTTDFKGSDEKYYLNLLSDDKVDGIIAVPSDDENWPIYNEIAGKGFPCVLVTKRLADVDIPYVIVDGEALGYQATEHLIQLGHRRIAFAGITDGPFSERFSGYRKALRAHEIPIENSIIEDCQFSWDGGYDAAGRLVQRRSAFSALFCHDDITTLGVMACLRERGLSIPEDVSIIGCDDVSVARMVSPALTTVAQPKSMQGEIAAQMLIDMINGKSVSSRILEPHLVIRQTTKEV